MADLNTVAELSARNTEIDARMAELDTASAERAMDTETSAEWNTLGEERAANDARIGEIETELEDRRATIASRMASGALGTEDGSDSYASARSFTTRSAGAARGEDIYDLPSNARFGEGSLARSLPEGQLRERALRAIEASTFHMPGVEQGKAQGEVETFVRSVAPEGMSSAMSDLVAERVIVTSSPAYQRAFPKLAGGRYHALTSEEAQAAERALQISATANYPVPVTLDPTIINVTSGAVNPIRSLATVTKISGNTWKGVTATTPTATRVGELTAATDNTPTLAQPSITVTKAHVFIPFTYEADEDWGALQSEMVKLIQRSKDLEEATSFTTGSGSGNNPQGVVTGGTTVTVGSSPAFSLSDLYKLIESVEPEWQASGRFLGTLSAYDLIRQFDTNGGAGLWKYLEEGAGIDGSGQAGVLLGRPAHVASKMATTVNAGTKALLFGDFSQYRIIDAIGLDIEYIPNLMDPTSGYPNGSRGIYAHWRNNAKVLVPAAISVLTR